MMEMQMDEQVQKKAVRRQEIYTTPLSPGLANTKHEKLRHCLDMIPS